MTETNRTKFKKCATAIAVASSLSILSCGAEAAGLGRITVLSALGQPLRAEVEIAANKNELTGMTARLAPADAFSQAGVDFASSLRDLRFSVERRANGRHVVKVTSFRPINEPFLDFLVELNWPSGRLVREYTFLLDPPDLMNKAAPAVTVADAKVVETLSGRESAARQAPAKTASRETVSAPPPKPAEKPAKETVKEAPAKPAKTDAAGSHVVKPGETLRKIAAENQYSGVSLEQMLVGLYQANPDAFAGRNINRLKSGAILSVPDQATVAAVSQEEARKVYIAHASDWNAYRQKLAAGVAKAPAKEEAAAVQASSGKITARVEDKAAPAEKPKDQVKVARTESNSKSGAAAEADRIAKEKALQEAQTRLAMLEKNVDELQKLVELKNKQLAELQKQPAVKPPEVAKPVEPPKVVEAPKPVEPPKPAETAKATEEAKPAEAAKPVELPKSAEEAKPAEEVKPAEPPKPEEVKPVEAPKPPPPPPAPLAEPEEDSGLLGNPLVLAGGGGVLALLAGLFFFMRRRQPESVSQETTALPSPSSLGPNSVFRMTGGQSIDTANVPAPTGDFSQTGPGSIDTDEVDPVAEADVYMAYGRDTQAEEILLEALQKDPQRTAIHAKLLEIYANRKSVKQFETLASELYGQTAGNGPDWEKVAQMGVVLDPGNPLYSGAQAQAPADDIESTLVKASLADTPALPEVEDKLPELDTTPEIADMPDFSTQTLDLSAVEPEPVEEAAPAADAPLDFEATTPLGGTPVVEPADDAYVDTVVTGETASDALDFDLGAVEPAAEVGAETLVAPAALSGDLAEEIVDFDLAPVADGEQTVQLTDASATPDFSPAGTMVMPRDGQREAVFAQPAPVAAPESFELPQEPADALEFDMDASAVQTVVNSTPGGFSTNENLIPEFATGAHEENPQLTKTQVSPDADSLEFDVKLTDSVFLGQPMAPDFDIGTINLDLAADAPAEPVAAPAAAEPAAAPVAEETVKDAHWEQVSTKLELAQAYEEMGDLEGARELLQEVVGEGSPDLVAQAREILGRIGG